MVDLRPLLPLRVRSRFRDVFAGTLSSPVSFRRCHNNHWNHVLVIDIALLKLTRDPLAGAEIQLVDKWNEQRRGRMKFVLPNSNLERSIEKGERLPGSN